MAVSESSRIAYYKRLLDGTARNNRQRIMRFLLQINKPVTRHQIADIFKPIWANAMIAFDGQKWIPLQSVCSAVNALVGDKEDPDYIRISHKGIDPITGANDVEFLVPIGEKWSQRRIFDV